MQTRSKRKETRRCSFPQQHRETRCPLTPQPRSVSVAHEHQELLAAREEHGQAAKIVRDIALVDAALIDPEEWFVAVIRNRAILAKFAQRRPFRARVVAPRMRDEELDGPEMSGERAVCL